MASSGIGKLFGRNRKAFRHWGVVCHEVARRRACHGGALPQAHNTVYVRRELSSDSSCYSRAELPKEESLPSCTDSANTYESASIPCYPEAQVSTHYGDGTPVVPMTRFIWRQDWQKQRNAPAIWSLLPFGIVAIAAATVGQGTSTSCAAVDEQPGKESKGTQGSNIPLPTDKLKCQFVSRADAERGVRDRQAVLVATGSFNPPTNMHMRMFEIARDALRAEGYDVIGAYMSPVNDQYVKRGLAEARHRTRMCQLAAESSDFVMVDRWEALQPEYQRTLSVLQRVEREVNSFNGGHNHDVPPCSVTLRPAADGDDEDDDGGRVRVVLLCGADLLESFNRPGVWIEEQVRSICRDFGVVCIARDGSNARRVVHESDLLYQHRRNIRVMEDWASNNISSTEVRRAMSRGLSPKYMVPDDVIQYMVDHRLYVNHSP